MILAPHAAAAATAKRDQASPTPPAEDFAPVRRVLVVDDDPDINRLVGLRLTARGFTVTTAMDGEEALGLLVTERVDLLFIDVSMPGISGLEVLDAVRAQKLDVAVIMMTAFGSEAIAVEALRRGADDYLRKPFDRVEFIATLDRTVQRQELRRQNAWLRTRLDQQRQQLEAELARAGVVQAELLPRTHPVIAPFELAARCVPAREVGGDFYDWQQAAPGDCWLTLADVMGKGMPAALWMATVRTAMRATVRDSQPDEAMRYIARALVPDLDRAEAFVTLFLARLDGARRHLTYVDAGHGHTFMRRADGSAELLRSGGLPVGVIPNESYTQGEVTFAPGDSLILYSDGLIDARPDLPLDAEYLASQLAGATNAEEMLGRLVALGIGENALPDDLTVVVLHLPDR